MVYTNIEIGVVASLELTFNNIHKINKLFGNKPVFIHRILAFPIDYDERCECFDSNILSLLMNSKNEDEFKMKAANIAELNDDCENPHLRRKIEYLDQNNNEDKILISEYKENDSIYNSFDVSQLIFDFFYKFSYIEANFDTYEKRSYDTVCNINSFTDNIKVCVSYFKEIGIGEDQLLISNYNELNM